jgi:hypothetical protein
MALLVPAARAVGGSANFTTARPGLTTLGTQIAASATPHALTGTPTQLIAATTIEAEWVYVAIHNSAVSNAITDGLVNIYIGAGGSETLFIDSLAAGWGGTLAGYLPKRFWFPVRIPRGTRISAEFRALIASDVCTVYIAVGNSNGEHWVGSGVETLGADTAASRGTAFTPGAASEGAWATMGTTGRRWRYINPQNIGNNDTSINAETLAVDIGTGSAVYQGMEGKTFMMNNTTVESNTSWEARGLWCDIPSGTSLQMRGQSHATPSGLTYGLLYGVY